MPEFIPAILPSDEDDLKQKVAELPPEINYFHLDVTRSNLVGQGSTLSGSRNFETHLMVQNPERIFAKWVERGARRVIVHKISEDILAYRGRVEIGLGFELDVPIETVLAEAEFADFVHIMSIAEIGKQGHPLDPRVFDRIKTVQEKFPNLPISVDGGITKENFQKLVEAGADRLIVGSHFKDLWLFLTNKS